MRLVKLAFRGLTRFTDIVTIDFDALGPGLIAIVGKNGAGKSTLMEAVPVALWKMFPSRTGFYENFQGQDAFIEAEFSGGVTIRLAVNAVKRTTEAYVLRDGAPLTDGKKAGFQAAVEEYFGSLPLFLASVFACQTKKGAFLGLVKSERKDMFVELLRLGILQVLSEDARTRRGAAEGLLAVARTRVDDLALQMGALAGSEAMLSVAIAKHLTESAAVVASRTIEEVVSSALQGAKAIAARAERLTIAASTAWIAVTDAQRSVLDAQELGPKAQRRREERTRFLDARKVRDLEPAARARHAAVGDRILQEKATVIQKLEALPDLAAATERKRVALIRRDEQAALIDAARTAYNSLDAAKRALSDAAASYSLQELGRQSLIDRLAQQAKRLEQVPCVSDMGWIAIEPDGAPDASGPHHDLAGACPLLADARAASGELALARNTEIDPAPVDRAKAALTGAEAVAAPFEGASLIPDKSIQAEIDSATEQIAQAASGEHLRERLLQFDAEHDRNNAQLADEIRISMAALSDAMIEQETILVEYHAAIEEAERTVAAAQSRLATARDVHAEAEQEAKDAAGVDLAHHERQFVAARKGREAAEFGLREADQAVARAQAAYDRLVELLPQHEAAVASVAGYEAEVGDWGLLERSLGRDGVQALEIDAAGPEVAKITNELLTACYGPRFSLTLETLAEKRDGGTREVFDIRVYDGGAERPVENLSGGEKVVVSEAIGLALAIFNAKKNNIKWETLWRDETAGALDPENAQAYVRMLRRARELGGFHQVLFVAHQPEVWEAADAQIHVADGTVYVQGEAVSDVK